MNRASSGASTTLVPKSIKVHIDSWAVNPSTQNPVRLYKKPLRLRSKGIKEKKWRWGSLLHSRFEEKRAELWRRKEKRRSRSEKANRSISWYISAYNFYILLISYSHILLFSLKVNMCSFQFLEMHNTMDSNLCSLNRICFGHLFILNQSC